MAQVPGETAIRGADPLSGMALATGDLHHKDWKTQAASAVPFNEESLSQQHWQFQIRSKERNRPEDPVFQRLLS